MKIYADLPITSVAIDLYVGDILIGEYYSFTGGVFFKVYGEDALKHYYGKSIRFVFDGTTYDLGVLFPNEKETLPFRQDSGQTKTLPKLKVLLDDQGIGNGGADDK